MTETLLDQIRALANDRNEIDGTANLRLLLKQAGAEGLVEHIPGRISMQPPKHHGEFILIMGRRIPIAGDWYDVYRLTDKALVNA